MSFPRYPEYKDSGVTWLGELPAHWGVSQSRRMFAVRSEPALESDKMLTASQKYGVLYQSDFVEREGRRVVEVILGIANLKHVEPDDFIISMRSFQGGIEWCKLRGSTSFHYVMLKPVKEVHPPFFAHLFKSSLYIQALRTTTDLIRDGQELRYSNFAQVDLPVVPMEEQAAIAGFLDRETAKIDALVAEQKKLIALLQEKRQAVISHAVTKGLDPNVPMKDSGVEWLGEVPGHWEVLPLKRCCSLLKDGTHLPPPRVADGVPLLSVRNVQNGQFGLLDDDSFISEKDYNELCRSFVPRPSDVLLAIVGATLGKTAVIPHGLGQFHIQRSLAIFRTNEQLNSDWLHLTFQSDGFQTLLWEYVGYSAQPGIYLGTLCDFRVPVPPIDEQERTTAMVKDRLDEFNELICEAESAVTLLQERRTALISAAVTGQIDVRGLVGGANAPDLVAASAYPASA